jgi:hypothetical protein
MSKRFFRFNTGRRYGPNGQRIYCLAEASDSVIRVYFWDGTREIRGMVAWDTDRELDSFPDWALEDNVLGHYDRNDYSYPPELERKVAEIVQHYKER